ncbi:hypothetical protein [Acinetobacter bereziniae]|nr:hypothetical protein [Acinetobacter bereziniae]
MLDATASKSKAIPTRISNNARGLLHLKYLIKNSESALV